MLRRATLTAVSLLAVLGVSACSPGSTTPPKTTPTESATTTSSSVPKVENPKNLKAITDACQLLTEAQVAQLGGDAGAKPPEESKSKYDESQCKWRNDAFTAYAAINTKAGGLAKIMDAAGSSDNFKETQVGGYQGARVDEQSNLCRIELAIADDQSLEVNYFKNAGGTPEMNDPCGYAEKITSEALKNIPDA
ncbi:DUF3558 domain-containing protein [Saccharopolyspora sp. NPDC050389]|uniref:DUF3558 domain-containing protein n=1 Tax=Saccharopolyspora sp. NPDC050389 TaxID=3155516 RepID=UPI0033DE8495